MGIDVERARADTPGCAEVVHLNNAGASLAPTSVLDTVIDHLRLEAAIGGYEAADRESERVEAVYQSIALLIGAEPHEIALVDSATRAWDLALASFRFDPGDRVLVAGAEYGSNVIALLQMARRTGATIDVVPDDADGALDVDALAAMLDDRVRLVAITHVPTQGGLVNPAAAIGRVCRSAGVPFLLDACQSVGQLPVRADEIGCDLLSATGRKFLRAPRGTGFLYVREELLDRLEPPELDLRGATWTSPHEYRVRDDARRFEQWESSVAGRLGLGRAVDYTLAWGIEPIAERVVALGKQLRTALAAVSGVAVHDRGRERCGIVTFTIGGIDAAAVADELRRQRINTSVSKATSAQFDLPARGLDELVRASVHYYNDDGDLDRLVEAVRGLASR